MKRYLPVVAAIGLLIFSGLVHGLWTDRWARSEELDAALARLEQVPMNFGSWQGVVQESDPDEFARAGARGYWVRQYTHRSKKASVVVILMCGRAGRMSVHTPEVCFRGSGYDMAAPPAAFPVTAGQDGALWTARFTKIADQGEVRLFWGWNKAGPWEAAASPRWHFRGLPFLYKLYVFHEAPSVRPDDGPMPEFFGEFIPVLQSTLFPR